MFIAGTERWKVVLVEPEALRIALYVRDAAGLTPHTDPEIPPLDPSWQWQPVWSRRPVEPAEPRGLRLLTRREVDPAVAAHQWARWWEHLLDAGSAAIDDLRPPHFPALLHVPDLRALVERHYHQACIWSDSLGGDPRIRHAHAAPGPGLNALIAELPTLLGRPPHDFSIRVSVIGVQSKQAWVLRPDHFLLTRRLTFDLENSLDWLRRRILAVA
ncbi:hypothetical protein [Nakamurella multipartita]|jgi:hypothetical protein|uniref:Uncharacterized protein n=1 Tax=Nakamurella multipartita (strain ATCC 700099 / DSM 44233 / CIP 104796 / JCM 9543 / NBRC 105858 / Y-104) TaxID=479431 RepID=C8XAI2_NAKMY|nr:hypothetical protein [Nakamurella multipartita]ACV77347.1 hypothetical protein Namu_0937 [Nakamurella multipartita DSM 44233]